MILLTGASGYIGGRLLAELETRGANIRCMTRRPAVLGKKTALSTEIIHADALCPASLIKALQGVHTAYYLIHSMATDGSYSEIDRQAAKNFTDAAKKCGIKRIIYVSALGSDRAHQSPHIKSREETGNLLRTSGIPVIELRVSIVIGAGSLAFEMIRLLVEQFPLLLTPKWLNELVQPISMNDLVEYLLKAQHLPQSASRIYEIGGASVLSYRELLALYTRIRGIHLRTIPLPIRMPRLVKTIFRMIAPEFSRVGEHLIDGISHASVVTDPAALSDFSINPLNAETALYQALNRDDQQFNIAHWSDALRYAQKSHLWGSHVGLRMIDARKVKISSPPKQVFRPITRIGGENGWYAWNSLWALRGWIDQVFGGPGLRRIRPENLYEGALIDFWHIEHYEPEKQLRLLADMRLPGRAWLDFEVVPDGPDASILYMTAVFDPFGFWGRLYWAVLYPIHHLVFVGLLKGIQKELKQEKHEP